MVAVDVAIAHRGPRDVAGWSLVGALVDHELSDTVADNRLWQRHLARPARMERPEGWDSPLLNCRAKAPQLGAAAAPTFEVIAATPVLPEPQVKEATPG